MENHNGKEKKRLESQGNWEIFFQRSCEITEINLSGSHAIISQTVNLSM